MYGTFCAETQQRPGSVEDEEESLQVARQGNEACRLRISYKGLGPEGHAEFALELHFLRVTLRAITCDLRRAPRRAPLTPTEIVLFTTSHNYSDKSSAFTSIVLCE